eukprot:TRINITY_DN3925_c0_g1_i3.p2 TRINITY_DN3925_c0_g1~~TRINITY_DN3925_c0_g1_i3.p2  ORF type:complete len:125 (+),score=17.03 TRINITY_DN3925_c0_g1_i3:145-519(+)
MLIFSFYYFVFVCVSPRKYLSISRGICPHFLTFHSSDCESKHFDASADCQAADSNNRHKQEAHSTLSRGEAGRSEYFRTDAIFSKQCLYSFLQPKHRFPVFMSNFIDCGSLSVSISSDFIHSQL